MATDSYWSRTRTLGRRHFLAATATTGAGAAALALTGCGDDDDSTSTPRASGAGATPSAAASAGASPAAVQPKRGGTLVTGQPQIISSDAMDPHTSLAEAATVWSYIGNTGLRPTRDLSKLENELVEKYEIPGDATEVILTVRQGVKWHNKPPTSGRALVADDVAFSLTRITGKLNPEKVALFQRASTLPNFDSATAVDEKTVRVKLKAPHSGFINGLADFRNSIVARDFVEKGGKFEEPATIPGTGAWTLDTWSNKVTAVYNANPNFWEKGKPYMDAIRWAGYGDRLSSLTDFSQGKTDYYDSPNKAEVDSLKRLGADYHEERALGGNWAHFRLNTTKAPFNDARVRRALHLALNYKAMNDAFYGTEPDEWHYTGSLINVFPEAFTPDEVGKMAGYNPATKDADIKAAKDLMSAAGFPDGGITFKFMTYPPPSEHVIRAMDQYKAVWPAMKVEVDLAADFTTFSLRQARSEFDALQYGISAGMDAAIEMATIHRTNGSRNYGKFSDATVDQLLDKSTTQFDSRARTETLKEVQRLLLDPHNPCIYLSTANWKTFFQKKVKGVENILVPLGGSNMYDVERRSKDLWLDKA